MKLWHISLLLTFALALASCGKSKSSIFTPELWAAGKDTCLETKAIRIKIWKDMEADHLRMGMSKDEIVDLLGEPENRSETQNTFIYCLGPRIIDYDSYAIDFDDNDRVVNYRYLPG